MYRLSPLHIDALIQSLETTKKYRLTDVSEKAHQVIDDVLEQLKSIQMVMGMTNQDYVYIIGRNPNKL